MSDKDTIYRQAAIDILSLGKEILSRVLDDTDVVGTDREKYSCGLGLIESYIKDIEELPPVQPGGWSRGKENSMSLINREELLKSFDLSEKTQKYGGDHSGYDTRMLYEIQNTIEDAAEVEAIPYQWIVEYVAWLKDIGGFGLSDVRAIQSMIIKWKMDNPQKHSGCGPDFCKIGG